MSARLSLLAFVFVVPFVRADDPPAVLQGDGIDRVLPVSVARFSGDGKKLATFGQVELPGAVTSYERQLIVWDLATGKRKFTDTNVVRAFAFAPDGKMLAVVDQRDSLRLLDEQGKEKLAFEKAPVGVRALAFSPDGKLLAAADDEDPATGTFKGGAVHLYDVATGKRTGQSYTLKAGVWALRFSPDGALLAAVGKDEKVQVWDVKEDKAQAPLAGAAGVVRGFAVPSNESVVVAATANERKATSVDVYFWDLQTRKQTTFKAPLPAPAKDATAHVEQVTLSEDGRWLGVVGVESTAERRVKTGYVWDLKAQKQVAILAGLFDPPTSLHFSPDGKRLAFSCGVARGKNSRGLVALLALPSDVPTQVRAGHRDMVNALAVSPDGKTLASGGGDGTRLWNLNDPKDTTSRVIETKATAGLAFHPEGKILALTRPEFAGDFPRGDVVLWDVVDGKMYKRLRLAADQTQYPCRAVLFAQSGETLFLGALWQARTNVAVFKSNWKNSERVYPDKEILGSPVSGYYVQLAASPPDNLLAACVYTAGEKTTRLRVVALDKEDRKTREFKDDEGDFAAVAFSPDGKWLVATEAKRIRVWEVANGKLQGKHDGHGRPAICVAVSKQGVIASGDEEGAVLLWDVATGKRLRTIRGHVGMVRAVAFTPDGETLFSAGQDGMIRSWSMK